MAILFVAFQVVCIIFQFIELGIGNVARIEMTGREVVFLYDDRGLPISSYLRERASGKTLGYQIFYDYEFR